MRNVNRVVLTGNLTHDPEMRDTQGGTKMCTMRLASNSGVKRDGQWQDKANYFDVLVFGAQAENCAKYLAKGRAIAIDGRLDWSEWEKDGQRRQAVRIVADSVQFLSEGKQDSGQSAPPESTPVQSTPDDDDIPFAFPIVPLDGVDVRGTTNR